MQFARYVLEPAQTHLHLSLSTLPRFLAWQALRASEIKWQFTCCVYICTCLLYACVKARAHHQCPLDHDSADPPNLNIYSLCVYACTCALMCVCTCLCMHSMTVSFEGQRTISGSLFFIFITWVLKIELRLSSESLSPPSPGHLTGPPHFPFWDSLTEHDHRIHLFVPKPPQSCMLRIQVGATVSNFHVGAGDCVQALHFTHWAISVAPGLTLKIPRLIYLIWSICYFPGIRLNRNNRWKEQRWKTWGRQPKKSVWRWKLNLQNYVAYTYIGRNNWSCRVNWG